MESFTAFDAVACRVLVSFQEVSALQYAVVGVHLLSQLGLLYSVSGMIVGDRLATNRCMVFMAMGLHEQCGMEVGVGLNWDIRSAWSVSICASHQ